ncbi:uncharacterized protein N0V89_004434 [Didymosphaeria variabile]|uniref:Uncharacterized protein n=1 Tax=Didymosphaeria variabile TaxID=1932322 RepID=A0A9W8XR64_9PLEO|nr:uncharacterized protein N0V89_004434 [Didymosphaeria variabile]KAJ4356401.1 hypothetical protein N0V89_004434 [Didymosphaeria variabile]
MGMVPTFPRNTPPTDPAHGTLPSSWHPIPEPDVGQVQQQISQEINIKYAQADSHQHTQHRTILKSSGPRKQTNYPLALGYWGSLNCVPNISQLPVDTRRAQKPARRVRFVDQTEVHPLTPFLPHHQYILQEEDYQAGITGYHHEDQPPSEHDANPLFEYSHEPVQYPINEAQDLAPSGEQRSHPNVDPTLDSVVFPWQLHTDERAG